MKYTKMRAISTTEQELDREMKQISRDNPKSIITTYARFSIADIYIYKTQPSTDTADTIQTYQEFGGFLKNGKVINPTKRWMDRHNFRPVSR